MSQIQAVVRLMSQLEYWNIPLTVKSKLSIVEHVPWPLHSHLTEIIKLAVYIYIYIYFQYLSHKLLPHILGNIYIFPIISTINKIIKINIVHYLCSITQSIIRTFRLGVSFTNSICFITPCFTVRTFPLNRNIKLPNFK